MPALPCGVCVRNQGLVGTSGSRRGLYSPMRWFPLFVCILVPGMLWADAGQAASVQEIDVQRAGDAYTVRFDTRLDAPADAVWRAVTDLANLKELSPRTIESTVLAPVEGADARLRLVLRPCILIYCKRIVKVSEVRFGDGEIRFSGIPELSDFSRAEERLQVDRAGEGTRLRYTAELVPTFRAPPLIGPWLIRRALRGDLIAMGERVERRARLDAKPDD